MQNGFSSIQVGYAAMGRTALDILNSPQTDFPRLTQIEPQLNIINQ